MVKFLFKIIRSYKEYILLFALSAVSLLVLSFNDSSQLVRLKQFAFGNFAVVSELINYPVSLFRQRESIEKLKRENANLMLELSRLKNRVDENNELRAAFNLRDSLEYPLIAADIISKTVNYIDGSFIINKGLEDGIRIGMPAISSSGLVGLVTEISHDYSVVRNLYNTRLKIAVTIKPLNLNGIMTWDGNKLIIKNIPSTYDIQIGSKVETSDFSTIFPPNLPIGEVTEREEVPVGFLHSVTVRPYTDIRTLYNVFIMQIVPDKKLDDIKLNLIKK
ncbi:Rod shape-determining protein MreC [Melioribacter roseus P3M-2]|uniref:Cell shape-determining protein MreC n=1 Tax=Melioribacter roseus (strain DSM 23840 / JCM 17771 / VKM B-2668 / P3M-2) TaxID=1191523 RepID=I6ZVM2_MELRP|nr:rod shape-determining protein MreC [Melioribacter roseus]AFN76049.1 Rod shape-determining protein MreC [Melioribacter roseus P3M-2]